MSSGTSSLKVHLLAYFQSFHSHLTVSNSEWSLLKCHAFSSVIIIWPTHQTEPAQKGKLEWCMTLYYNCGVLQLLMTTMKWHLVKNYWSDCHEIWYGYSYLQKGISYWFWWPPKLLCSTIHHITLACNLVTKNGHAFICCGLAGGWVIGWPLIILQCKNLNCADILTYFLCYLTFC